MKFKWNFLQILVALRTRYYHLCIVRMIYLIGIISGIMLKWKILVISNRSVLTLYLVGGEVATKEVTPKTFFIRKIQITYCNTCILMFYASFFFWNGWMQTSITVMYLRNIILCLKGGALSVDTTLYLKWRNMNHILPPFSSRYIYLHGCSRLKWWKLYYVS